MYLSLELMCGGLPIPHVTHHSTWQVLGVEELITVLGDRPHSKSTDYDEFINAAWTPPTATVEPAVAPAAAAVPGPGEQSDGPR